MLVRLEAGDTSTRWWVGGGLAGRGGAGGGGGGGEGGFTKTGTGCGGGMAFGGGASTALTLVFSKWCDTTDGGRRSSTMVRDSLAERGGE